MMHHNWKGLLSFQLVHKHGYNHRWPSNVWGERDGQHKQKKSSEVHRLSIYYDKPILIDIFIGAM